MSRLSISNEKLLFFQLNSLSENSLQHSISQIFEHVNSKIPDINFERDRNSIRDLSEHYEKENSLANLYPDLTNEWHPTKNGELKPQHITSKSSSAVWWICDKGHEWKTRVSHRVNNHGCPFCAGQRVTPDKSLAKTNPELAKEWHPTKNGVLTPNDFLPQAHAKAWWICSKGHEYQSQISNRTRGGGCSYCNGKKVSIEMSLEVAYPELAKEWHPTKNGILTPKNVMPGSNKKAWWVCEKGHEWEAVIGSRKKNGCPYCKNKKVNKDNCIETINPDVFKIWHPTRNNISSNNVTEWSSKKVWWICKKGHEWQASISSISRGIGCPYCSGKKASNNNNFEVEYPLLTQQWNYNKNLYKPSDFTSGSNKKVWWICEKGHEWESTISNRKNGRGCPYCNGKRTCSDNSLSSLKPEIAKEWHPTKNKELTPNNVTLGSDKKVWWVCEKGHEWETQIKHRGLKNTGCPYCTGKKASKDNSLSKINPDLAKEWHPSKNNKLTPENVTCGSNKKVWWLCSKGHEYEAIISDRNKGNGCSYCSGKKVSKENSLLFINPTLSKEWHPNNQLTPDKVTCYSGKKVWWQCMKGHEWEAIISNRSKGSGCPYCRRRKN